MKTQHSHTANPVGKATPHKHTAAQGFYIGKNTGSCGGEAGNNLEKSILKQRYFTAEIKWESAENTEHNPAQRH